MYKYVLDKCMAFWVSGSDPTKLDKKAEVIRKVDENSDESISGKFSKHVLHLEVCRELPSWNLAIMNSRLLEQDEQFDAPSDFLYPVVNVFLSLVQSLLPF